MDDQRTAGWFLSRLGKATASNFDKIMTGEKYAGWKNLKAELVAERLTGKRYAELTGRDFTTFEMQWGTDNEPLARLHYRLRTGNEVEECGFFEHETLAAGASPDGLIGEDGAVEIKCPNTATHIETLHKGTVPRQYWAQVQGQLWITGRKWSDFISFDPRLPENANIIIIHTPRDDAYIAKMEAEVTRFLQQVEEECRFVNDFKVNKTTNSVAITREQVNKADSPFIKK
jgi:putative phage-type endonuclease